MEALDGNHRQSRIPSIAEHQKIDRINNDRSYSPLNTMAATAVVSPTSSMYSSGPPPPYTSSWPPAAPRSTTGLISPPDSRRTSDNKTEAPQIPIGQSQHRQSLPSIHEALRHDPPETSYRSPVATSFTSQTPFSQAPSIPRTYPPSSEPASYPSSSTSQRQPSPTLPIHPQPNSFSRAEPATYPESSRQPSSPRYQVAPGPPNPFATSRHETSRFEPEARHPERPPSGYTYQIQPPLTQGSYTYGPPPHQKAVTSHNGSSSHHNAYRPRDEPAETWKSLPEKNETVFKQGLKRHLDGYDFENNLEGVLRGSSEVKEWSEYYHRIVQEQSRSTHSVPDRMPDSQACAVMLNHAHMILSNLKKMHDMVREHEQSMLADQRMRDQGTRSGAYDDEVSMYGDDMKNSGYGENKKRRGRAAPPGRCHSCNRAETPEWRRGPDGARTLCNACGLHYAKLTRKNTMKQSQGSNGNGSSLRPKSIDGSDSRPAMQ